MPALRWPLRDFTRVRQLSAFTVWIPLHSHEIEEDPSSTAPTVGSAHTSPAAMPPMDHKTEPTADSEPEPAMKNELKSNEDPKSETTTDPGLTKCVSLP